jgi:hypothetical protein
MSDKPTMADALAAGDGTLHGAIDFWRARSIAAECVIAHLLRVHENRDDTDSRTLARQMVDASAEGRKVAT